MLRAILFLPVAMLLSAVAAAEPMSDTLLTRVEILAAMESLRAQILAGHSATRVLESWCADHGWATPPPIRALRGAEPSKPIDADRRKALQIGPDEPVGYRHVRLVCGTRTLSEADNWYVPSRLSPEMNKQLETTDTPFGKVVASLGIRRESLGSQVIWSPLRPGWERNVPPDHPDVILDVPPVLFENSALLFDRERRPISLVEEHYTRDILDVPVRK